MKLHRGWLWVGSGVLATGFVACVLAAKPPRDMTKSSIETAAKRAVATTTRAVSENRAVRPGLVHWHPDLAAAQAAARKSGKPVLLFQMMGRLDREFC